MAVKGLRQAAQENAVSIMNGILGARWECTVMDPAGDPKPFYCRSNDVHLVVDPGTDQVVVGRQVTVVVLISELIAAGFEAIGSVIDDTQKPWTVKFENINGIEAAFKVVSALPDHTLDLNTLVLELYDE